MLKNLKEKYFEKTKLIKIDPLGKEILFIYTNKIPKARNKRSDKLGKLENKLDKDVDGLFCEYKGNMAILIDERATAGVISHEAYHAVINIFTSIGVEEFDQEIVAYHLGYIVDEITNFLKEHK